MSLRQKLFIYLFLIILIMMIMVGYLVARQQQRVIKEELKTSSIFLVNTLAKISREPLLIYDIGSLEQNVDSYKKENNIIYARIVNNKNIIIADNDRNKEGNKIKNSFNREKDIEIIETQDRLVSRAKIELNNEYKGYAEVALSLQTMKEKIINIIKLIILIFAIGFTISMITANKIINHFIKPVVMLAKAVRKIPEGNQELSFIKSKKHLFKNEVGELCNSILWMNNQLKLAEEKLIKKTQLETIGKLSSYIAHEIRNPLEAISGAIEVIKINNEEMVNNEYINVISQEISELDIFLQEFVSLSYTDDVKLDVKFSTVNLKELINETLIVLKPVLEKNKVDINISSTSENLYVKGAPHQLKSIFTNIIINANEMMNKEVNKLDIILAEENKYNVVKIKDNGPGIEKKNIENIFNPFFTTKENGTGIGLSIVKKMVQIHRGKVKVTSEKGSGTCFTILLPKLTDRDKQN